HLDAAQRQGPALGAAGAHGRPLARLPRRPPPSRPRGPAPVRVRAGGLGARRGGAPGAGRRAGAVSPADHGAGASPTVAGPGAEAPDSDDALLEWRREFPTVEATLHFISHSLGAMPRGVEESLRQYAQTWKARGIRAWDESWMAVPAEVAGLAERILNAEAGSVSLHANVTLAQASALSGVDFAPPRNRLVCTAEDFPSVLYLYEGLARRGVEVARVPVRSGHEVEEDDVLAAIDERTAIVAISHVLFRTSRVLDLQPIVRRAHAAGARVMIDAYQAVGTVPLNVAALDIDLLAGGSVKWLCGGPGAGYLYARPRARATLEPAFT